MCQPEDITVQSPGMCFTYLFVILYPHSFLTSALDGGEWLASHFTPTLSSGKESLAFTEQEAGLAQELAWTFGDEKTLLSPPRTKPQYLGQTAHSLIMISTVLS
jgi:hypothetical protein